MNFNHPSKGGSTTVTRTVCAVAFLAFSFCWLYFFQADILALAQHILSGGQTHYNRFVGAVLITAALFLLQLIVYVVTRLQKRSHALTYLPSMLLLAAVSDVNTDIDSGFSFRAWWWVAPLVLALWLVMVVGARAIQPYEEERFGGLFSRRIWINLLTMALMMLGVGLAANGNAVFHYRASAETALIEGDYEKALLAGRRSLETDASLTALRAYALSRRGELGERLFSYPVAGTGADLLLLGSEARFVRFPADSLYRHLGARPRQGMSADRYLRNLNLGGQATDAAGDYVLCGHLLNRNLDAFVREVTHYYNIAEGQQLPRHYREALVLYTHQRAHPLFVYHDAVTDEDYDNLQQLEAEYADPEERKLQVMERYAGSYWYYFEYCR